MNTILKLGISLLFLFFSATIATSQNAEIEGDLIIKYTGESQMLSLERFNPEITFGPSLTSTHKWSFGVSTSQLTLIDTPPINPYYIQNNNLNINYDGNTLGSINYVSGKYNRPATGTADLLPYAYGRIEPSSTNVVAGTTNYTVERKFYGADIIFSEEIVRELVINATPIQEYSAVVLVSPNLKNSTASEQADEIIIVYPTEGNNDTDAQRTIKVYLQDSSGSTKKDASFSFVAYKPN